MKFRGLLATIAVLTCLANAMAQNQSATQPTIPASMPADQTDIKQALERALELQKKLQIDVGRISADAKLVVLSPDTQPAASQPASAPSDDADVQQILEHFRKIAATQRGLQPANPSGLESLPDAPAATSKPTATSNPAVTSPLKQQLEIRKKARALIDKLASADAKQAAQIEQSLAELGPAVMVPLKLAEVSENFDTRQKASKISARLRWRFACGADQASKNQYVIDIMSVDDAAKRASLVDDIASGGSAEWTGFLGECLADSQTYVRQRAIEGLATIAGESYKDNPARQAAVGLLVKALDDSDRNIRLLAAGTMAKIRAVDVARLAELLKDESLEVRLTAIRAMGFSGDKAALAHLSPLLEDKHWRVRAAAMEAMSKLDSKGAGLAPSVFKRLDDEDDFVRVLAAKLLGEWEVKAAAPRILELMRQDKLSDDAALETLATLGSSDGLDEAMARYQKAASPQRKIELIKAMSHYGKSTKVDSLLMQSLDDPQFATHLPSLISLVRKRENRATFFPRVARFLESDDDAIQQAAWAVIQYDADDTALPEDVASRLLASPKIGKARYVLLAAYEKNDPSLADVLYKSLGHPSAEVASLGLAMISNIAFSDPMGEDLPYRYRGSDDSKKPDPPRKEPLVAALKHADKRVRIRSAAILYRSGLSSDQQVTGILRDALKSDNWEDKSGALAGIVAAPQPFLENIDLDAMAKDSRTRPRAIEIISNIGDGKFAGTLIELARNESFDNRGMMKALLRTGDDAALELVKKKMAGKEPYEIASLAKELSGSSGTGAVKFLEAALALKGEDYQRREFVNVALTLKDPSVVDLLTKLMKDKKLMSYSSSAEKIKLRLAELQPDKYLAEVKKTLIDGDESQAYSIMDGLGEKQPTPQLVDLFLEVSQRRTKPAPVAFRQMVNWLPADDLRKKFLPAMGTFEPGLQQMVLDRLSTVAVAADVPAMAQVKAGSPAAREYLCAMLAQLTVDDPSMRGDLSKLPPTALANMLDAAGDWPDAGQVLPLYLKDSRPEVAQAATRGLALFLIGSPAQPADQAWKDAFLESVKSSDSPTAYLCAEVLAQRWKDALASVESDRITDRAAALRVALALGSGAPEALKKRVAATLSPKTDRASTDLPFFGGRRPQPRPESSQLSGLEMRLALLTAAAAPDESYKKAIESLLANHDEWPRDPRAKAAMAAGLGEQLCKPPFLRCLTPKLLADAVSKARGGDSGGDPSLMVYLAQANLWTDPKPGDLALVLRAADRSDRSAYEAGALLDWALLWAPDQPDDTIIKQMSSTKVSGVLAAAVAAVRWHSPEARAVLIKAAAAGGGDNSRSNLRSTIAILAAQIAAKPEDAAPLVEALGKIKKDSRDTKDSQVQLLAIIAPQEARKFLEKQSEDDRSADQITLMELLPLWADQADWKADEDTSRQSYRTPADSIVLLAMLAPAKEEYAGRGRSSSKPSASALDSVAGFIMQPLGLSDSRGETEPLSDYQARDLVARAMRSMASHSDDEDSHDSFMRMRRGYPVAANTSTPERYYTSFRKQSPLGLYVADRELKQKILATVNGNSSVRTNALRLAADWRLAAIGDDLAKRLAEAKDGEEFVETAWALADIQGPKAAPAIAAAYSKQTDVATRVRMACLLRMLGSEAGEADVQRGMRLLRTRSMRLLFTATEESSDSREEYIMYDHPSRRPVPSETTTSLRERLLSWRAALATALPKDVAQLELALNLIDEERENKPANSKIAPAAASWKPVATSSGLLNLRGLEHNSLPIEPLASFGQWDQLKSRSVNDSSKDYSLLFADLCSAEQQLEPYFLVQFADQSANIQDLQDRWAQWWAANRTKLPQEWHRQALDQATAELAHASWWHRARAARRLMRLTGQSIDPPNIFDLAAWKTLQQSWQQKLAAGQKLNPRQWVLQAAVQAKVLPEGAAAHATDDAACLADLVKTAGFAKAPLSQAAALQLQTWPDREALVKASVAWLDCPRIGLAHWSRTHLAELTGKVKVHYDSEDLKTPATRPATQPSMRPSR